MLHICQVNPNVTESQLSSHAADTFTYPYFCFLLFREEGFHTATITLSYHQIKTKMCWPERHLDGTYNSHLFLVIFSLKQHHARLCSLAPSLVCFHCLKHSSIENGHITSSAGFFYEIHYRAVSKHRTLEIQPYINQTPTFKM